MATETPNHEYNIPERGEREWHQPLDENTARLDTDVEIRDAEANRSEYTPKDGALFRATDSGAIYHGNGTDWVKLPLDAERVTATALHLELRSSTPDDPTVTNVYLDDGTNTASGEPALRVYDGSAWVDQN